jgi:hypothetical protein
VLTDLRQENNYRLLIANLLKRKPTLVIQMNPVGEYDLSKVIDLRTDSDLLESCRKYGLHEIFISDASLCNFELYVTSQVSFREARTASATI